MGNEPIPRDTVESVTVAKLSVITTESVNKPELSPSSEFSKTAIRLG